METLMSFFDKHGSRVWRGKYLRDCRFMIQRLSDFNDNEEKPLSSFKASDIYPFTDYLTQLGLSDSTVNRYLACYSGLFSLAVEMEQAEDVPKVRWKKVSKARPRYFTDLEMSHMQAFLRNSKNPWIADFVILAVNTGMRLGEILSINNPKSKTKGYVTPCGSFVTLQDTKNGEERLVPLNLSAKDALYRLHNRPWSHYSHRRFYDTWRDMRDELAPGDDNYVFHVLRHTCATKLAMEHNVDAITLGKILGHRSQATTAKYVHTKPGSLHNIMSKLDMSEAS